MRQEQPESEVSLDVLVERKLTEVVVDSTDNQLHTKGNGRKKVEVLEYFRPQNILLNGNVRKAGEGSYEQKVARVITSLAPERANAFYKLDECGSYQPVFYYKIRID